MNNESSKKRLTVVVCVCLAGVTLAAYAAGLQNEFVNYDDPVYITENPHVQGGLCWQSIRWAFGTGYASNWHPLTWLSLMLDYELFGLEPRGFHLTNLLFHVANSLLLFWVLARMTGAFWRSAFVAAVFAVHPLHVESVAWAAERKDVLSSFFWILTMGSYAGYVQRGGWIRYSATLLLFALGLMAKAMLVTLPIIMLVLDYWPLSRRQAAQLSVGGLSRVQNFSKGKRKDPTIRYLLLEKLPFFILAGISSVITLQVQQQGGAVAALDVLSLGIRFGNALSSYIIYLGQTFLPLRLAVYYPHPHVLAAWHIGGAALLLAAISAAVWIGRRGYLLCGWLWYLVTLGPVIGLVQVGTQGRADRYMYIPMIGVLIMLAWGLGELAEKWRLRKATFRTAAVVCLAALTAGTFRQVGYWRNGLTLFEHALAVTKRNHVAHLNLGNALIMQKQSDQAITHYRKALAIKKDYSDAYFNLGMTYFLNGMTDEAIKNYYLSLRNEPDCPKTHYHLGNALAQQEKFESAVMHYRQAVQNGGDNPQIHNNLALTLVRQGKIDEAIGQYTIALQYDPRSPAVHNNLASALAQQDKHTEAIEHYRVTLELNPDFAQAHYNLANVLRKLGRADEALAHYQTAIEIDPNDPDAHFNFGLALQRLKRDDDAIARFKEAIRLKSDFAQAYYYLGLALSRQNKIDEALQQFRHVLKLHPRDAEMHCNMAVLLLHQGRTDEAIKELRLALTYDPNLKRAHEQLQAITSP